MPIFDFVCKVCHKRFESLVISKERIVCPECKSENLEKLFSKFSLHGTTTQDSKCTSCNLKSCSNCL